MYICFRVCVPKYELAISRRDSAFRVGRMPLFTSSVRITVNNHTEVYMVRNKLDHSKIEITVAGQGSCRTSRCQQSAQWPFAFDGRWGKVFGHIFYLSSFDATCSWLYRMGRKSTSNFRLNLASVFCIRYFLKGFPRTGHYCFPLVLSWRSSAQRRGRKMLSIFPSWPALPSGACLKLKPL